MKPEGSHRGIVLTVGSAAASGCNFLSFVVLPSVFGTTDLQTFTQHNYLGGLYLFTIASSVGPLSVFILNEGSGKSLLRYSAISLAAFIAIGGGAFWLASFPSSYACLIAAVCMHCAGFLLALLIKENRLMLASILQTVQPASFSALILLNEYHLFAIHEWAWAYLVSALICVVAFMATANKSKIMALVHERQRQVAPWQSISGRMLLCISFPLFFQLELILCGTLQTADLGTYAILQKLYSSIAISLFGSLGIFMITHGPRKPSMGSMSTYIIPAIASAVLVLAACGVVLLFGRQQVMTHAVVVEAMIVSMLFTVSNFLALQLTSQRPRSGVRVFAGALLVYLLFFIWQRPASAGGMLVAAGLFFSAYVVLAFCCSLESIGRARAARYR